MAHKKNKYGGLVAPIGRGILNMVIREMFVQAGSKTAHRGGDRQSIWRKFFKVGIWGQKIK